MSTPKKVKVKYKEKEKMLFYHNNCKITGNIRRMIKSKVKKIRHQRFLVLQFQDQMILTSHYPPSNHIEHPIKSIQHPYSIFTKCKLPLIYHKHKKVPDQYKLFSLRCMHEHLWKNYSNIIIQHFIMDCFLYKNLPTSSIF